MKKFFYIFIIVFAIIVILLIANGLYCDQNIKVTNYTVKNSKSNVKLRFVIISDLHNKQFGENNRELIKLVKKQKPDFIAVCGDMIVRGNTDTSIMKSVLSQLKDIAPTYCCLGNHERDMTDQIDFAAEINPTGAVLLDNTSLIFTKDGKNILIGGLSDFPYYDEFAPEYNTPDRYFWDKFKAQAKENFAVLLHHQPEYIADYAADSGIDIITCGHTHGGQIQIPFVGGLITPNQGLFPKYDIGEYDFGNTKMIICSGLGNNTIIPRINNQIEFCVVDID